MNERIRELVEQAGAEFWQRIESDGVLNKEAYITFDPPQSLEKFAELIVMECLNKISGLIIEENFEQDIGPYEKWNQALGNAALEIEQHFFEDAHK